MDVKRLRNDLFLIFALLLVAAISLIVVLSYSSSKYLKATISVQNDVVEVIDLSKKEDKEYIIHGLNGDLRVHTHDGAIAVISSNCPHQDCVHMGYVKQSNRPIICAYNGVIIVIEGGENDLELY